MSDGFCLDERLSPAVPPSISIVVCSFNRLDCLRDCMNAIRAQLAATPGAELIVVDDGSTDGTGAWLDQQPPHPSVTLLRQSNQGLSSARNRGWRAAGGDWVAYLDDDALPVADWLPQLASACAAAPAEIAVIGGPIRLQWPGPQPTWLPPSLYEWLTCLDVPGGPQDSSTTPLFRGANMTCRKSALAAVGGFSESLGRKGTSLLSREECELADRLVSRGWRSRYEPAPWIWHRVHPARLRRRWFFRRLYWEGLSLQTADSPARSGPPLRRRARALLYAVKKISRPTVLARALRFDRPSRQTEAIAELCFHLGCAHGIWRTGATH